MRSGAYAQLGAILALRWSHFAIVPAAASSTSACDLYSQSANSIKLTFCGQVRRLATIRESRYGAIERPLEYRRGWQAIVGDIICGRWFQKPTAGDRTPFVSSTRTILVYHGPNQLRRFAAKRYFVGLRRRHKGSWKRLFLQPRQSNNCKWSGASNRIL